MSGSQIVSVYADGGTDGRTPIGTWAWVHVDKRGQYIAEGAGILCPSDIGHRKIKSDWMEVYALLLAIESLPDKWSGPVHSDSTGPLSVISGQKLGRIPMPWATRIRWARRRLGKIELIHVAGHPTLSELAQGFRRRLTPIPVSEHNVYVDRRCHEVGRIEWKRLIREHVPTGSLPA